MPMHLTPGSAVLTINNELARVGASVIFWRKKDEIGVESGEIIASSKGLHIYKYVEELAKIRKNKNNLK